MKNYILLLLLNLVILGTYTYGSGFIIKLASYTNQKSLMQQVHLLDPSIQNNIMLIKEDNLYKLFSKSTQSREEASILLPRYKKIFSDAYIMLDRYTQKEKKSINLSLALQQESNTTQNTYPNIHPIQKILQPKKEILSQVSFQELIKNKTFYLCPQKIMAPSEKILIKAHFTDHTVSYTTLIGNIPYLEMNYMVKNNRLYMINHNRVSISQFSTIDKILFEYMVVSRWMKGKKIHQMRYYKKEEDARSYIDSINLN
jgi:hypothetical protein